MTLSTPPVQEAPRRPIPIGPSEDEWTAMSPEARTAFLVEVNEALSDPRDLMREGRPHQQAKARAIDLLGLHFKALGRTIYLAEELSVVYPGEASFSPDVIAIVGVPQPEDDERLAWVVAEEKRGLDLALEVLHNGDRNKDLVRNVERYARLGIPEYFVYDRAQQRVHGFRLPAKAKRYRRIVPKAGRYTSEVLGLDLAVQGGKLRFFHGMAELFGTEALIDRLTGMVEHLEAKADAAAALAQQEAERAQQEAMRAQQEASHARRAIEGIQGAVLMALEARGVGCTDALRARVAETDDPAVLQRWLLRALTAATAEDVVREG